jgi:hypothetical protein
LAASFSSNCTAFDGHRLLAAGARLDVALALKRAHGAGERDRCWPSTTRPAP